MSTLAAGAPWNREPKPPSTLRWLPKVAEVTGRYFVNRRQAPASTVVDNQRLAAELWRVSAELTGLAA